MALTAIDLGHDPRKAPYSLTAEQCEFMAAIEGLNLERPEILPDTPYSTQKNLVREWARRRGKGGGAA